MSKPRKTPIPLPESKSKPALPSPKDALSQEFINDSDDSAAETAQSKKKTPKKAAVTIAVHRPKNGVVKETSKAAAKKQKEAAKSAPKAKAEVKKPAPKQVQNEQDGASSSSSEEDDSDEDSETDIQKAQKREQEEKKKGASSGDSSSSSSGSDSSSEEESEDEHAPAPTPKPVESQPKPTPTKSHAVDFVAARPYVPPKDYHPMSTTRAHTTQPTPLFDSLPTSGKQIWHITAPSSVPLKSLKEIISMEQALSSTTPLLTHQSTNYGFVNLSQDDTPSSASSNSAAVIIPSQSGFSPIPLPITQTLHIRELVSLPALSSLQADPNTGSEAAASITRSTIRAPRPQLKGLKMRYFPSGATEHKPVTLGSDDEADAPPSKKSKKNKKGTEGGGGGLAVPSVKHIGVAGKRKLDVDADGDVAMEEPAKKVKKVRAEGEKKAKKEKEKEKKKKSKA